MKKMRAQQAYENTFTPSTSNSAASGSRFGNVLKTSALDVDCQVRGTDNLFVDDGSFTTNGGSVTPTFTIYTNAFTVANKIKGQLDKAP